MPLDKAALGQRFVCFECETRFYDLNRPEPTCPNCGLDQREEPAAGTEKEAAPAKKEKPAAPAKPEADDSAIDELLETAQAQDADEDEEDGLAELGVPEMVEEENDQDD